MEGFQRMLREHHKVGMEGKECGPQSSPVFALRTQRRAAKVQDSPPPKNVEQGIYDRSQKRSNFF